MQYIILCIERSWLLVSGAETNGYVCSYPFNMVVAIALVFLYKNGIANQNKYPFVITFLMHKV